MKDPTNQESYPTSAPAFPDGILVAPTSTPVRQGGLREAGPCAKCSLLDELGPCDEHHVRQFLERSVDSQGLAEGWQLDGETGEERLAFYGENDINAAGTVTLRDSLGPCVALQILVTPERATEIIEYVVSGRGFVRLLPSEESSSIDGAGVQEAINLSRAA